MSDSLPLFGTPRPKVTYPMDPSLGCPGLKTFGVRRMCDQLRGVLFIAPVQGPEALGDFIHTCQRLRDPDWDKRSGNA